ncbi:signal peptidase I [Candidatus Saccharibacteria bacterium]|nr:signal peptidase I [Candidatus Saccharibacteria bacterium]
MSETTEPNAPVAETPSRPVETSRWRDTFSTLGIIILAPLVALFLTAFVFQSYQVEGPSMETTLQDKDRLIVTKLNRTWARVTSHDYIPQRYEIIIFNHTGEYANSQFVTEKQLIKRVIGLPGDRVVVKDGVVTIYNDERPDGFLVDREGPEKNTISQSPGNIDDVVQDGEVFVMGDNRTNSLDSRNFGPIRAQDIVGKLRLRIYPFDHANKF